MNLAHIGSTRSQLALGAASQTLAGKALLCICASVFVAACAHISMPLPFTPVPLTFSDLAVLLVGLALGPELAFSALVLYLAEGASGLPVFNPGGLGGTLQLFGKTGGYLLAYPLAAAIAGGLCRLLVKRLPRFGAALAAAAVASAFIMVCGTVWIGFFLHVSAATAFQFGALPFLPGQVVKVCSAAGIYASLVRWRRA